MFQTFVETDFRLVPDELPGLGDVGERVHHVTLSTRDVVGGDLFSEQVVDRRDDVVDADFLSAGDVDGLAFCFTCIGCEDICVDDVFDEREIARLRTVAVHRRRLVVENGRHKRGDGGCVLTLRVLPRSEDIEIAQGDCFETEALVEGATIHLAGEFLDGVRA